MEYLAFILIIPVVSVFVGWIFSTREDPSAHKAFKRISDSH